MRILLVEDDPVLRPFVLPDSGRPRGRLGRAPGDSAGLPAGHHVVVVLDPGLPDGDGLALLPRCASNKEPPAVLILTAAGPPVRSRTRPRPGRRLPRQAVRTAGLVARLRARWHTAVRDGTRRQIELGALTIDPARVW
jgi:hypothetical protein